jgi:hypothetical protein
MGPTAGLVDLEKRKIWSLLGLQLVGWLVGSLVGWFTGYLVGGWVGWLVGRSVCLGGYSW